MCKTPCDGVANDAQRTAFLTPRIRVDDAALQHGPVGLEVLADSAQAELIKAAEGREIRVAEGSVGHVEVFRWVRENFHLGKTSTPFQAPTRQPHTRTATPSTAKSRFTPRSPLTWIKPRILLGNYLRNATEHLLFATKGKAPVRYKSQPTWMFAPLQAHSHKPEEQFAVIERISGGPYLELFARRRPPSSADWSVWGNEVDSDISIPGYPVPSDRTPKQEPPVKEAE